MTGRLLGMLAMAVCLPSVAWAQTDDPPEWRTPWGHPDLQGVWDYRTMTPLQRPRDLGDQAVFTEAEAEAYRARELEGRADYEAAPTVHAPFWLDYGTTLTEDRRTSLIVDPPDGRIPAYTAVAEARARGRRAGRGRSHGVEDRSIGERCILGFNAGPPMTPSAYNNNVLVLQTPDTIVLHNEMVHEVRIVPLDGRPYLPGTVRQIRGDSRGRWEGRTLVIETVNFTDRTAFMGSGAQMRLVERLTRVDEDTLRYEYTVHDTESFVRPWSVALPMKRSDARMFEFACHEGNYGLRNILRAARAADHREDGAP